MKNKEFMFGDIGPEKVSPEFYDELTDLRASKRSKDYIKNLIIEKGFPEEYATEISIQIDKEVEENKISQGKAMAVIGGILLILASYVLLYINIPLKGKYLFIVLAAGVFAKGMNTYLYYKYENEQKPYWKR